MWLRDYNWVIALSSSLVKSVHKKLSLCLTKRESAFLYSDASCITTGSGVEVSLCSAKVLVLSHIAPESLGDME